MAVNVFLKRDHWDWVIATKDPNPYRSWRPELRRDIKFWLEEKGICVRLKEHKLRINPHTKERSEKPVRYMSLDFGLPSEALVFKLTWA